jgi:hypothetical protein
VTPVADVAAGCSHLPFTLYQEWIGNDRQRRRLIAQMRQIAAQASKIHLATAARD